jgi:hypothetical protein
MSTVEHLPPGSPWRRWLPHVDWRPRLRWFAAEFLVVVVGILTALALNAWWQARQDAAREKNYLALISRDLGQMGSELEELRGFEDDQIRNGLLAYQIISASTHTPAQEQEVSRIISQLHTRRTMAVVDAAYEDLTSTGNLWLIRDPKLRDRIVTFYEWAERELAVHNRNNAFFVDELFVDRMFGQGLFL